MSETQTPGQLLEQRITESLPQSAYVRKLNTPSPPATLVRYLLSTIRGAGIDLPGWVWQSAQRLEKGFTSNQPYDMLIGVPIDDVVHGHVLFAVECKSVATPSLPHDQIKTHQVDGLLDALGKGVNAGFLVEFRGEAQARLYWLPVVAFTAWLASTDRKSIPESKVAELGAALHLQPLGPRQRFRRWDLSPLFRRHGAVAA